MKDDRLRQICLISMAVVLLSGLMRIVMYFVKKAEISISPFVPDAVVEQIASPYITKAVFLLSVAGITLIPFFMKRYKLTIGICVLAMIIERFILIFES